MGVSQCLFGMRLPLTESVPNPLLSHLRPLPDLDHAETAFASFLLSVLRAFSTRALSGCPHAIFPHSHPPLLDRHACVHACTCYFLPFCDGAACAEDEDGGEVGLDGVGEARVRDVWKGEECEEGRD